MSMKDNFMRISRITKGKLHTLMGVLLRDSGLMEWLVALEYSHIKMGLSTKDIG